MRCTSGNVSVGLHCFVFLAHFVVFEYRDEYFNQIYGEKKMVILDPASSGAFISGMSQLFPLHRKSFLCSKLVSKDALRSSALLWTTQSLRHGSFLTHSLYTFFFFFLKPGLCKKSRSIWTHNVGTA